MANPATPGQPGSPTEEPRDTPDAATSLLAQAPGIHTVVKSASDATLVETEGAGSLRLGMKKLSVHSASEPSSLGKQSRQSKFNKENFGGLKSSVVLDEQCELEDTPQKEQPDFDEMDGDAFDNSDELPAELEEDLLGVKGVSCFGIGVLCERCPLVIYCSPKCKDEAREALKKIHDGLDKKPFMVVIWQDICIQGTYDPTFTGKDTLGLSSSDYSSALGLPVTVDGREALLGTFHCLMGQLLYTLPAVQDQNATSADIENALTPFKNSMNHTDDRGLKPLLTTRRADAQSKLSSAAAGVTSPEYFKAQKEFQFYDMLLNACIFDMTPDSLTLHIECPNSIPFTAYSDSCSDEDREVGIEAIGGVPKPHPGSLGEVAVYFTKGKGVNVDVSHPESASQPSMVQENENLEPETSGVWKKGPASGETTGKIVYTCMRFVVTNLHMRDISLRGAVGVKYFDGTDLFSKRGDSSTVVYLKKKDLTKKENPKLLGAISAVARPKPGDKWVWTYGDCRQDQARSTPTDKPWVMTKGFTVVIPYFNQFQVVKDHLKYDIELRSAKPAFY